MCDIPSITTGTVRTRQTQNRRFIEASSGLGSSVAITVRGSKAIPQLGQEPGPVRTISGCIGHTYSTRDVGPAVITGSSAMPHLGQAPGVDAFTSASMGHVYTVSPGA